MKDLQQLQAMNEAAEALAATTARIRADLKAIAELAANLPSAVELHEIAEEAVCLQTALSDATQTYQSDEFPCPCCLDERAQAAVAISACLESAAETFNAAEFPSVEQLEDLANSAGQLAGCLSKCAGE